MISSIMNRPRIFRDKGSTSESTTTNVILFVVASLLFLIYFQGNPHTVTATSINYGVSQPPITDVNQLMPKLCQNESVICEGSYCIPGVSKCVCDLRMPVQFGRFCLRQLDIETKCFVTNQCNHTVKDAVCIDINSNAILNPESSKFKLEQWQHLNDLRQSQAALPKDVPKKQIYTVTSDTPTQQMLLVDSNFNSFNFESRDHVIMAKARTSPYEISYNTQELLLQNHTRRRTNNSDRSLNQASNSIQSTPVTTIRDSMPQATNTDFATPRVTLTTSTSAPITSELPETRANLQNVPNQSTISTTTEGARSRQDTPGASSINKTQDQKKFNDLGGRKTMIVKSPNWPPGICSCPFGFMFDSMLRKCLALSLIESHCQIDSDCKQINSAHCSLVSRRCECDEPLQWDQKDLSCVRPKIPSTVETPSLKKESSFIDNLLPPLILAKLLPDQTMLLLIFVVLIILGTLLVLKCTVKCFSSSNSALISPKTKKKKSASGNLPPRSPYATLRRPDHKPNSQLSNFTQATRGRILNYDFEQEGLENDGDNLTRSTSSATGQVQKANQKQATCEHSGTLRSTNKAIIDQSNKDFSKPDVNDQLMDLNDNISVSQMESESKSDNSVLNIPVAPPTQQPPYMLKSAMKGQGSAIAAAAAAVANKRMQLAQKKNLEQQSSSQLANGSPVFL